MVVAHCFGKFVNTMVYINCKRSFFHDAECENAPVIICLVLRCASKKNAKQGAIREKRIH